MVTMIDAHIHLDQYTDKQIGAMMRENQRWGVEALIAVATNQASAERTLQLSQRYAAVFPAVGYHPEQALPDENELADLLSWMDRHQQRMVAIGEVGLPYYLHRTQGVEREGYKDMLTVFIQKAAQWDLPLVLHAVYEDADEACDLLERHSIEHAHFHWFKGSMKTLERLRENGYHISFTPDICYKPKRHRMVQAYPLELIMVETDGPWPFDGPFAGMQTRPKMMRRSLETIAELRKIRSDELGEVVRETTRDFFRLHNPLSNSKS